MSIDKEFEAPEVVAWMWRDINGDMQFNYMHPEGKPLMTVAQHHRIVAAKDAEIARLKAVLVGAEYPNVDNLVNFSIEDCENIGSEVATITKEIIYERDELRAELEQQATVPNDSRIVTTSQLVEWQRLIDSYSPGSGSNESYVAQDIGEIIYTAPPRSAGPVMPARIGQVGTGYYPPECQQYDDGWNDCLDEFKRLNGDKGDD